MPSTKPIFSVRASGAAGEFTGYLSAFGVTDSHGTRIRPGAFAKSLARHRAANTVPALLWAHDHSQPIGGWLNLEEDGKGLLGTGHLELSIKQAADAYALMRHGYVGLSVGIEYPLKSRIQSNDGVDELIEVDLHEASIVSMPANPEARIVGVRSRPVTPRECESALRELGYSNKEAKRFMSGGWAAMSKAESDEAAAADLVQKINRITNSI